MTCTLASDLTGEVIQIAGDGVVLDGGRHSLTSKHVNTIVQPYGVYVEQRSAVTIKNLTVEQFQAGIMLRGCSASTVTGNMVRGSARVGIELFESNNNLVARNTLSGTGDGISVNQSAGNTLEENVTKLNRDSGIILSNGASGNTLTRNTSKMNSGGVTLGGSSSQNMLRDNDISGNRHMGVAVYFSSNENVLFGNRISGNAAGVPNGAGILVMQASGNRFSNNTVAGNSRGIWLSYPNTGTYSGGGNEVYNNNFIDNGTQAMVTGRRSAPDVFSKTAPTGGNYWASWTTPDVDGDRFVDSAFQFSGGGDSLPWSAEDGWVIPSDTAARKSVVSMPEPRP